MENDLNEIGLIEIDLKENALITNRSNFFQSPLESDLNENALIGSCSNGKHSKENVLIGNCSNWKII